MLSKTDFFTYLDAPMHLWAQAHNQLETVTLSPYEEYLIQQGQAVESLARQYIQEVILAQNPHLRLEWQPSYDDGRFNIRADALIWDENAKVYDLYEIKSSTSVNKDHENDLGFQVLLLETILPLRHAYLLHINKTYQHGHNLDLKSFFTVENLTNRVEERREEIADLRQAAWEVTQTAVPHPEFACTKPSTCPCPALCHPNLPQNSIYNLPRIGKKAHTLREMGILAIDEIPPEFNLSPTQQIHQEAVRKGQVIIQTRAIQESLASLQYPLYFLDYETFNPAVPLFSGYRPYEHIVFQYSLFVVEELGAEPLHFDALFADGRDPTPLIVPDLLEHLGERGSVVVWNKSFEAGRNEDLARHCPTYAERLLGINDRLYDLMLIFQNGLYVHPDFQGSASLKAVLPVVCPDLQYADLSIQDGQSAMLTWLQLHNDEFLLAERDRIIPEMKAYCKMDTFGMVAIWRQLHTL